jgi:hypothetical protein
VAGISLAGLGVVLQLAARNLRRRWQEEPPSARRLWWEQVFCTPVLAVGFFRRWMRWKLEHNPIGWLEQRTWSARLIMWSWFALIASLNSFAADLFRQDFRYVQSLLALLLTGSIALSAAGSFRRERETGLLELLLVSPLTAGQIIGGRLRGLWAQFLPASLVLVGVWLYFANVFGHGRADWLWAYGCTFFTLPVIGLYFSLKRTHFISALLWTVVIGLVLPLVLGVFNDRIAQAFLVSSRGRPFAIDERPLFVSSIVQIAFAVMLGRKLYDDLVRRSFAFQQGGG